MSLVVLKNYSLTCIISCFIVSLEFFSNFFSSLPPRGNQASGMCFKYFHNLDYIAFLLNIFGNFSMLKHVDLIHLL